MSKFKFLVAATLFAMSIMAPALAHGSRTRPQTYGTEGREVAAPPWSAACMTDQGPSECGEPMWVYGGTHAGQRNAF
jgi:hypothetical protein